MMIFRSVMTALVLFVASSLYAQSFNGTFTADTSDGKNILILQQSGKSVTGSYTVSGTKLVITAQADGAKATGTAVLEGTPVKFQVAFTWEGQKLVAEVTEMDENGKPDKLTTERIVFTGSGSVPKESGPAAKGSSNFLDSGGLKTVANNVKTNFKRAKGDTVLSAGDPPLTLASVAAFAELLKLTHGVEMTEAEFEVTSRHFVQYYDKGDAETKKMLAGGWQQIYDQLMKSSPEEKEKGIGEIRQVFNNSFAAGAQQGMPWAVAMKKAIDMRSNTVAEIKGDAPAYAKKSDLHKAMTEADLEASLEMLYFMWVASGRDANLVTADAVAAVRSAIVQNFPTFPQDVQYVFANAQKVYSSLRGEWAQASAQKRLQMAQAFSVSLDALGLTVPQAGGNDTIHASGAWSDVNGKSHGEWAGEMVQGLAGSSYHNAWSGS